MILGKSKIDCLMSVVSDGMYALASPEVGCAPAHVADSSDHLSA